MGSGPPSLLLWFRSRHRLWMALRRVRLSRPSGLVTLGSVSPTVRVGLHRVRLSDRRGWSPGGLTSSQVEPCIRASIPCPRVLAPVYSRGSSGLSMHHIDANPSSSVAGGVCVPGPSSPDPWKGGRGSGRSLSGHGDPLRPRPHPLRPRRRALLLHGCLPLGGVARPLSTGLRLGHGREREGARQGRKRRPRPGHGPAHAVDAQSLVVPPVPRQGPQGRDCRGQDLRPAEAERGAEMRHGRGRERPQAGRRRPRRRAHPGAELEEPGARPGDPPQRVRQPAWRRHGPPRPRGQGHKAKRRAAYRWSVYRTDSFEVGGRKAVAYMARPLAKRPPRRGRGLRAQPLRRREGAHPLPQKRCAISGGRARSSWRSSRPKVPPHRAGHVRRRARPRRRARLP